MSVKLRAFLLPIVLLFPLFVCLAQQPVEQVPVDKSAPVPVDNTAQPPRSDSQVPPGESSSKQTEIDISPPPGDAKNHSGADLGTPSDSGEFTPWNPMKAMKDIEVGDFYFKRDNYPAAISRYREALEYKPHDAEATYKLGAALERSGDLNGAMQDYQDYLKILPRGPYAAKAQKAIDRLKEKGITTAQSTAQPR
jgi:tetratricopeptide (TPR) repeat protein